VIKVYTDLLQNEHLYDNNYTEISFEEITKGLHFFEKRGNLTFSEDGSNFTIKDKECLLCL
jgi:hypothetical protein